MPWRAGTLRCAGYAKDAAGGRMDELAVDPACIVGGEEGDDVADVAWIGYSSERVLGRRPGLCRPISEPIGHVGIGETWRDRVHGDLAIAKIPCDGAGQGADRPFGRRVHGRHRAGEISGRRRHIDDPAAILHTTKAVPIMNSGAFTFTAKRRSKSSSETSFTRPQTTSPALLTRMSNRSACLSNVVQRASAA